MFSSTTKMKSLNAYLAAGPLHKLSTQYDEELKNLILEVGAAANQQQQLSEQMLRMERGLLDIREKHRNFMASVANEEGKPVAEIDLTNES